MLLRVIWASNAHRKFCSPGCSFMVLLDELGVDRERFIVPVSSEELFSYIDSFVLEEEERERLEVHRDFCD
ncbi:hypothetical protein GOODEAATRI_012365 [Goodea atripinnis]|uniref:DUF4174 domain-containing protein n=1 Tax=Goodea atripinnis TaxID=208336 RepID=A0ABV0PMY6_9TELE